MKFIISTEEFNYLVHKCQSIVSQKPAIPLLGNILIEAYNNELILTATDNAIALRASTESKVLEEGATTLPARTLASLVRELKSSNLEISTNEHHITTFKADSSRFKLNGMDRNGFPHLPDLTGVPHLKLPQKELKEAFFRTSFAVSRDDKRHELMGLLLSLKEGRATFVGTDGKKLARCFTSIAAHSEINGNFILPLKTVEEVQKNLADDGEVSIYFLGEKVAFQTLNTLIIAKILLGEYPDYTQVIPQEARYQVQLHREELSTLLRQVALFRPDTSHSACFSFDRGQLTLFANTMEVGEGVVSMPVDWRGERFDVAFNPSVWIDILRHCKNEVVTLNLVDPFHPGTVTDEEPGGMAPFFLVMPMRLQHAST